METPFDPHIPVPAEKITYWTVENSRSSVYSVYTDVFSHTESGVLKGLGDLRNQYHPLKFGTRPEELPKMQPDGTWKMTVCRSRKEA